MLKKTSSALLSFLIAACAAVTPAAAGNFAENTAGSPIRALSVPQFSLSPASQTPGQAPELGKDASEVPGLNAAEVPSAGDAAAAIAQPGAAQAAFTAAEGTSDPTSTGRKEASIEQVGSPTLERALNAPASPEKSDRAAQPEALNNLFDNSRNAAEGAEIHLAANPSGTSTPLQPASYSQGERSGDHGTPQPPRSSFKRSLRVGLLGALGMLASIGIPTTIASALGYHFHSNYNGAAMGDHMSLLMAGAWMIIGAVMAPVAEEMIFRVGVHGVLKRLPLLRSPWVTATIGALIFTAVHETSDPVLFFGRFLGAMILARVYQKEGVAASMSAHGIYNGLLFLAPLLVVAFGGLGQLLAMAVLPLAALHGFLAWRKLKADRADRKAGRIVPFNINGKVGASLALLLLAGFFFLIPTPVWLLGALGWFIYARRQKRAAKP